MRKRHSHSLILISFLLLFSYNSIAQEKNKYTHNALAEKVYLQLDNDVYINNKTIWFKAILINAATHKTNRSSGVLYVDLIDSSKKIVASRLVKIENGIGHGQIKLNKKNESGTYLLRAYTEWNKNFDKNFIYEKYIKVYNASNGEEILEPIQDIKQFEEEENTFISAKFLPDAIDASHTSKLTAIITTEKSSDTVLVNKRKGKYVLEYKVSEDLDKVELGFITENKYKYSKNIALQNSFVDIQFFPESGYLVHNLPSRIGFKAVGIDGKGKMVEGELLNNKDEIITSFKSNTLGMGSFLLDQVNSSENYSVRLKEIDGYDKTYTLPKVNARGITFSVNEEYENLKLNIYSSEQKQTSINLKGVCRGYEYYNSVIDLTNGKGELRIPKNKFPEGVIAFTLSEQNNPKAERLYFNKRPNRRLNIKPKLLNNRIASREPVNLQLEINSNDTPLNSNVSLLVFDKLNSGKLQDKRDNILSYFLLNADIKGNIESPGAYFRDNTDLNIDDLMLTQGWNRFVYKKPTENLTYKMEKGLEISGVVNVRNPKKDKEDLDIVLMSFDKDRTVYQQTFKVPGSFNFQLEDTFGYSVDLAFQAINKSEKELKNYKITLQDREPLEIEFKYNDIMVARDSILSQVVSYNKEQIKREEDYYFSISGVTQLDEVIIEGYNLTPERKKVYDRYGKPNVVIEADEIKDKEQDWSYGVVNVLQDFFRDKLTVRSSTSDGLGYPVLVSNTESGRSGAPTLVVVDGFPVVNFDYYLLQYLQVDAVKSVEVIDNADRFGTLYLKVNPGARPPIPSRGSVVAIYTKEGSGIHAALGRSDKQVDIETIPVFSVEKEFYVPKYENKSEIDFSIPDVRLPVYWQPSIPVDENGKLTKRFYHSDSTGDFIIVIEAISPNGQIGYQEIEYTVTSPTNN